VGSLYAEYPQYHEFVLKGMQKAQQMAKGSKDKFIEYFNKFVRDPLLENPDMVNKKGW
jgi:hypothetical protein